ncbi:hypothetical protein LDG_6451 [Legionella drancourtii LLAP12]|uniref:Uncharacterized protein n=1 Tax=Legionella drancourtii LLAP12 TaxID=658187 RepID=G9EMI4_9GAMM|nr:hypothetical protein LDG_6451 [Legionella drancourtii LLAP12]
MSSFAKARPIVLFPAPIGPIRKIFRTLTMLIFNYIPL